MSREFSGWQQHGACRREDPELFFPPEVELVEDRRAREREARAICAGCPVRLACLEWAIATGQRLGIWGGADFGAHFGPLCKNRIHLMDGTNAWLSRTGALVCLACRNATEGNRPRRLAQENTEVA
jgi:WhiB family redox-sensing transcriptional regulator